MIVSMVHKAPQGIYVIHIVLVMLHTMYRESIAVYRLVSTSIKITISMINITISITNLSLLSFHNI